MEGFRRNLAWLIGIDEYANGIPPLRTPVADAEALAHVLHTQHGFTAEVRVNEEATLPRLQALFETLATRVERDDRVLIYFAGHGVALDGDSGPSGYLLPQNAHPSDIESFLPMAFIAGVLDKLPCRHLLVVLDCCFAGTFRWATTRHFAALPEKLHRQRYAWFIDSFACQALLSAAHDQRALDVIAGQPIGERDDDNNHSPFARALLDGLEGAADRLGADGKGDGVITATELYLYLRERLTPPPSSLRPQQTPSLWPLARHDKGEFVFLVPGCTPDLPSAPELSEASNPWRGLKPYERAHADLFFGRRLVSEALLEQVLEQRLVVVTGPSGIGKSSLVRAGLLPRLEPRGWKIIVTRPGSRPLVSLRASFREVAEHGAPGEETLRTNAGAVASWARDHAPGGALLVVDQAEELLTSGRARRDLEVYLNLLATALADATGPLRVLLTIRSEFEPQLRESVLKKHWDAGRFLVRPMTQDELRRVIEAPAAARVMRFESDELVDTLVNEVVQMPGALPLLSFALAEVYAHFIRRGSADRTLRFEDYQALDGGVTGALRGRAEQILRAMDQAQQSSARRLLQRMVSVDTGEFVRRRVRGTELEGTDEVESARNRTIVQLLENSRLVVGDQLDGESYFELAHDALIHSWGRLQQWLREDAVLIRSLRRLTADADAWNAARAKQGGLLWTDPARQADLQQLVAAKPPMLNRVERQFAQETASKARRNRYIRASLIMLLVVATITATVFGVLARQREHIAVSRELAAEAMASIREGAVDRGLLLSVAAGDRATTLEASAALLNSLVTAGFLRYFLFDEGTRFERSVLIEEGHTLAVADIQGRLRFADVEGRRWLGPAIAAHDGRIHAMAYDRHKKEIVTGGYDRKIRFWRRGTQSPLRDVAIPGNAPLQAIALSPDGRHLAVGTDVVRIHDLQTGEWSEPLSAAAAKTFTRAVAFSPGGSLLAFCFDNGEIHIYDRAARRLKHPPLRGHDKSYVTVEFDPATGRQTEQTRTDASVDALAFSADGAQLVTGGYDGRGLIWDVTTGKSVGTPFAAGFGGGTVKAVGFVDNGLIVVAHGNRATIWDYDHARTFGPPLVGHATEITGITVSDSEWQIVTTGADGRVGVWEPGQWSLGQTYSDKSTSSDVQKTRARGIAFVNDRTVLTSSLNKRLARWDLTTEAAPLALGGELPASAGEVLLASHEDRVAHVVLNELSLWEVSSTGATQLGKAVTLPRAVQAVRFFPDGKRLLIVDVQGGLQELAVPDLAAAERAQTPVRRVKNAAITNTVNRIGFAADNQLIVIDAKSHAVLLERDYQRIDDIAFNSDGSLIAVTSGARAEIVSVDDGQLLHSLEMGAAFVSKRPLFSPDARTLITYGTDIMVWQVQSGVRLATLANPYLRSGGYYAFSPDGRQLAEADGWGNLSVWQLYPDDWRHIACSIANRPLSAEEGIRYKLDDSQRAELCSTTAPPQKAITEG